MLANRNQHAPLIRVLLAGMVLSTASILILQEESRSPNANTTTGGDARWWGIVTITTVGYGDFYPVTSLGRITAVFVMFAGIGIIGALASILASLLVSPATPDEAVPAATASATDAILGELAALRMEVAGQRAELVALRASLSRDTQVT